METLCDAERAIMDACERNWERMTAHYDDKEKFDKANKDEAKATSVLYWFTKIHYGGNENR